MVRRNQAYKHKAQFQCPYESSKLGQTETLLYKWAQSQPKYTPLKTL